MTEDSILTMTLTPFFPLNTISTLRTPVEATGTEAAGGHIMEMEGVMAKTKAGTIAVAISGARIIQVN
jgi:hypothetical protein